MAKFYQNPFMSTGAVIILFYLLELPFITSFGRKIRNNTHHWSRKNNY